MTTRLDRDARDAACRALDQLSNTPVLIVGDVMLDQFLFGRVDRISPEAPVPIVEFSHEEFRLGGAANVAHNVRALGGHPLLVGTVGADEAGRRLVQCLDDIHVAAGGLVIDSSRTTTRKVRIVTSLNQQVARVDYENDAELSVETEGHLLAAIDEGIGVARAAVVSDYLKGTITARVVSRLVEQGRARRVPVLVDPKIPHLHYYAGVFLVTPNHREAETATHVRIRSATDAEAAARAFRARVRCENVLVTRGEHGMYLLDGSSGGGQHLMSAAREVADVTGAGDTVIATLALGLAAGADLPLSARLANAAAGIVVGKFGPATATRDELLACL